MEKDRLSIKNLPKVSLNCDGVGSSLEAPGDGMPTLGRSDARHPMPGRGHSDQPAVPARPASLRRVDDQIDIAGLDQPHRVVRAFGDLVDIGGGDAMSRQVPGRPVSGEDPEPDLSENMADLDPVRLVPIRQ